MIRLSLFFNQKERKTHMIQLTYKGDAQTVLDNTTVPFNTVKKSGCAERYEATTNTLTLVKPGRYLITASANVALPTGVAGTAEVAIATNGVPVSTMESSPYATGLYNNISSQIYVDVYPCCCKTVSLLVTSASVLINNQNLTAVRVNG